MSAREGDLQSEVVWPEIPALLKFHELVVASITKAGGSVTGGRQLLSWALRAGAEREEVQAGLGSWCYGNVTDKKVWGMLLP